MRSKFNCIALQLQLQRKKTDSHREFYVVSIIECMTRLSVCVTVYRFISSFQQQDGHLIPVVSPAWHFFLLNFFFLINGLVSSEQKLLALIALDLMIVHTPPRPVTSIR